MVNIKLVLISANAEAVRLLSPNFLMVFHMDCDYLLIVKGCQPFILSNLFVLVFMVHFSPSI